MTFAKYVPDEMFERVLQQNREMQRLVIFCTTHNIDAKEIYLKFQNEVLNVNQKFIDNLKKMIHAEVNDPT